MGVGGGGEGGGGVVGGGDRLALRRLRRGGGGERGLYGAHRTGLLGVGRGAGGGVGEGVALGGAARPLGSGAAAARRRRGHQPDGWRGQGGVLRTVGGGKRVHPAHVLKVPAEIVGAEAEAGSAEQRHQLGGDANRKPPGSPRSNGLPRSSTQIGVCRGGPLLKLGCRGPLYPACGIAAYCSLRCRGRRTYLLTYLSK